MPEWHLAFPVESLDERITMRSVLARLQADPHHVRTALEGRASGLWTYLIDFEGESKDQAIQSLLRRYEVVTVNLPLRPNANGDVFPLPRLTLPLGPSTPFLPLRRNIDYQSHSSRTFLIEQLPEGALPVYDRDPVPGLPPRSITMAPTSTRPAEPEPARSTRFERINEESEDDSTED